MQAGMGIYGRIKRVWRNRIKPFWGEIRFWVVVGCWLAALGLGCAGFARSCAAHGEKQSYLNIFYLSLQLFTFQSGAVPPPVPWELEVARLLAPATAAYTALSALGLLFREQLQMLRLYFIKNHVIVCGLGRKGLRLVKDFLDRGDRVVVIEMDPRNDEIETCREQGVIVLIGNAADEGLLQRARVKRAKGLVAICGNDGTNVETAAHTYELLKDSPRPFQCLVHIVDFKLCTLFKQLRLFTNLEDPFEVRVFNVFENSARLLLKEYPLDREGITPKDPRAVHLVVVGFGHMGESVALQAAKTGHYANGRKMRITVIDRYADAEHRSFDSRFPQFSQICEIVFIKTEIEDRTILGKMAEWAEDRNSLMTVVVCFDSDTRALSCAMALSPKLRERQVPLMVRIAEEAGLGSLLQSEMVRADWATSVHAFGLIHRTCAREIAMNEDLDLLAKEIHRDFTERREKEGRSPSNPSQRLWPYLDEELKDSNRQQADHTPVKLRAIGCEIVFPEEAEPEPAPVEFTPDEVELLAHMEHARWMAERFLNGWTYAAGDKDAAKKTHPCLVPWEQLPEDIKKYDREAVRNIPHLVRMTGGRIHRRPDVSAG